MCGVIGNITIFSCIFVYVKGDKAKVESEEYNFILGLISGYPMIKMISIFTIV